MSKTMCLVFSLILVCNVSTLMASKMLSKRKGMIKILKNAINKDIMHIHTEHFDLAIPPKAVCMLSSSPRIKQYLELLRLPVVRGDNSILYC